MTQPPDLLQVPSSTYRLQFHAKFTLQDAIAQTDYLHRLGIGACYASPLLKARKGSTHGYDICDHRSINPEIGTEAELETWARKLRGQAMGLILDVVPNHMGIDPQENPWWHDVLENGPNSRYAAYFDIDWNSIKPELRNKVLLPILGDLYGVVLERGDLRLLREGDRLELAHFETRLPISAQNAPDLYREAFEHPDRFNGSPDDPASFDRLHALLEKQWYRLAYWKTALQEINYRRFFDVNHLAGLRVEDSQVFAESHAKVLDWIGRGWVTGVRLDHPDGLYDPEAYFETLQEAALAARWRASDPESSEEARLKALRDWRLAGRKADPTGPTARPLYVLVEKILSPGETLQPHWGVHGTTGYDFLNEVLGLFVDPEGRSTLEELAGRYSAGPRDFEIEVYRSKRLIASTSMASELFVLSHVLNRISEMNRRHRDYTLENLREALREVVACFPVYRTYVTQSRCSAFDRARIHEAIDAAKHRNPAMESSIFAFIRDSLAPQGVAGVSEREEPARLAFAMKFQQYTAPVQAKGVEDTAFYRFLRLVALNEVGGHPAYFGNTVSAFHQSNLDRQAQWPNTMVATATHDTKRGEDARVRIAAISSMANVWAAQIQTWRAHNARHTSALSPRLSAPDAADEYLFYQTLVGAWPVDGHREDLPQRMVTYIRKAIREAKRHTSWITPNATYEEGVERFVHSVLNDPGFVKPFSEFAARIAFCGAQHSLSQLLLKIASPGVPDFYQGTELWDLSLVDPDNRGAVDFAKRTDCLNEFEPLCRQAVQGPTPLADSFLDGLLSGWTNGRVKFWTMLCALQARKRLPELFLKGTYTPMVSANPASDSFVALARMYGPQAAIVVVPKKPPIESFAPWRLGEKAWSMSALEIPAALPRGRYRNGFTGDPILISSSSEPLSPLLARFPVALLLTESL